MTCEYQLDYYNRSLLNRETWAFRMFDMYSKLPPGILHRNVRHFGLFTECLNFQHTSTSADIGIIKGQYCTISHTSSSIGLPIDKDRLHWRDIGRLARDHNLRFQSGICVPDSCNDTQVKAFANSILEGADLVATNVFCQKNEPFSLSIIDYFVIVIMFILAFLIIASTVYEIRLRKRSNAAKNYLTAFSLYTNTKELLKIDYTKSRKNIECMNGLRSLAAFWVIAGHRIFRDSRMMSRPLNPSNVVASSTLAILMTVDYAVDVFFLLSSILVTHSCMRALDAKKLNLGKIYFNRYMRYTPSVAILILFILSFLPYVLVNGPSIRFLNENVKACQEFFWSALLMIQNYVNVNRICLSHTWYLNADFQLYLISPIFVYIMWKFGYKSFWLFGPIIASVQISIFFARFNDTVHEDVIYRQMHFRIGQWLTGIGLGYIMYRVQQKEDFKMNKIVQYGFWILTSTLFISTEIYYQILRPQILSTAIYAATHRIFATCFFGWIIFSFHHLKAGNVFRWFLSHPLWQPTARLSLSIYLVHDIYIILSVTNIKELSYFDVSWMLHIIAGDIVMSVLFATLLYLLTEAPVANLLNYFLK